MVFSDLVLEKIVLEVRYDTAFLYWDSSGKTLSQILAKYPSFEIRDVNVNNSILDWWSEGAALTVSHNMANITQDYPNSLDTFKSVASTVCDAVRTNLGVDIFSRVGLRFFLTHAFATDAEARDFFVRLGLISVRTDALRAFVEGQIHEEQIVLGYESEDRGYGFRFSHVSRVPTVHMSRPITANTEKFKAHVMMFDVDCYTKKRVEASVFSASDFVRINHRTLEGHLLRLVGL